MFCFLVPRLRLLPALRLTVIGLQGHAAKNQDLLVASGAIHLTGSDGLSAVDDDIQAAVRKLPFRFPFLLQEV